MVGKQSFGVWRGLCEVCEFFRVRAEDVESVVCCCHEGICRTCGDDAFHVVHVVYVYPLFTVVVKTVKVIACCEPHVMDFVAKNDEVVVG